MASIIQGSEDALERWLARGPSERDIDSTLRTMCRGRHSGCVARLLRAGARVNAAHGRGASSLHAACISGSADACGQLLAAGADLGARDTRGCTPLHAACIYGDVDTVGLLIAAGAKVDPCNANGCTPLHLACGADAIPLPRYARRDGPAPDREGVIARLLEAGADVNSRDFHDLRPLHLAYRAEREGCIAALLRGGADPEAECRRGRKPADFRPRQPFSKDAFSDTADTLLLPRQHEVGRLPKPARCRRGVPHGGDMADA